MVGVGITPPKVLGTPKPSRRHDQEDVGRLLRRHHPRCPPSRGAQGVVLITRRRPVRWRELLAADVAVALGEPRTPVIWGRLPRPRRRPSAPAMRHADSANAAQMERRVGRLASVVFGVTDAPRRLVMPVDGGWISAAWPNRSAKASVCRQTLDISRQSFVSRPRLREGLPAEADAQRRPVIRRSRLCR